MVTGTLCEPEALQQGAEVTRSFLFIAFERRAERRSSDGT